jgi:membrane-anchored glycerophosphoryl diester phosphodiesterase (GDPDase)
MLSADNTLNVFKHSVVLILQSFMVPSELALVKFQFSLFYLRFILMLADLAIYLIMFCESIENITSFTKLACPLKSFNNFPDFKP